MIRTFRNFAGEDTPRKAASRGQTAEDALRSFISVPMVSPNGVIGLIAAFSDGPDAFDANHIRLLSAIGNNATIAVQNVRAFSEMRSMYQETIMALAEAIDAKDHYTHGHSDAVRRYAAHVAPRLGLPHEELRQLEDAALLHDIGKISVPETILNKPGRLTPEEMAVIQSHTARGADMLAKTPHLRELIPIVRHHHERYDGKGYPDGLHGETITVSARIVALADSYDAMTSDRI